MSIQDALRSIPAKPGAIIACCLALGVGGWQAITTYRTCIHRAALTETLKTNLAAAATDPAEFRLAAAVPFDWDEVRIVQAYRPQTKSLNCPFGLHWSAVERTALADSGRLTVLGFFDRGNFIDFIDFRSDWARFDVDTAALPRARAVFAVEPSGTAEGPVTLRPISP